MISIVMDYPRALIKIMSTVNQAPEITVMETTGVSTHFLTKPVSINSPLKSLVISNTYR